MDEELIRLWYNCFKSLIFDINNATSLNDMLNNFNLCKRVLKRIETEYGDIVSPDGGIADASDLKSDAR